LDYPGINKTVAIINKPLYTESVTVGRIYPM